MCEHYLVLSVPGYKAIDQTYEYTIHATNHGEQLNKFARGSIHEEFSQISAF